MSTIFHRHLEGIEQQIHDLEMQLADLPPCADESHADFDVSDAPVTHSELTAMSARIYAHCNSIGSIAECTNARKHIVDLLLDELESSVEPIPLTAFYLLLLDQPDSFYTQSQGIWSTLCSEQYLDLPDELKRRLLDPEIRAVLHRDRQATCSLLNLCDLIVYLLRKLKCFVCLCRFSGQCRTRSRISKCNYRSNQFRFRTHSSSTFFSHSLFYFFHQFFFFCLFPHVRSTKY
jgi:hypothetical protein